MTILDKGRYAKGIISGDSTPHAYPTDRKIGSDADHAGSFSIPEDKVPLKPPLSLDEQFDRLRECGLAVDEEDRGRVKKVLAQTNYYRLSGFWLTLQQDKRFVPGTTFDDILAIVDFDTELRHLVSKAIAPVEIMFRTQFAYVLSHEYGADITDSNWVFLDAFKDEQQYEESKKLIKRDVERSKKARVPCVVHHMDKYGTLPLWALVEILSLGTVSKLYGNLADNRIKNKISEEFGLRYDYFMSWIAFLTYVRNLCAHHERLYNRVMTKNLAGTVISGCIQIGYFWCFRYSCTFTRELSRTSGLRFEKS